MLKNTIDEIYKETHSIEIERDRASQALLNIENRTRTSLFPWRGQFSPQLIEHILNTHHVKNATILDPFCGSGSTLFEATRNQHRCYGADINPAAYLFASIAEFSNLKHQDRHSIIKELRRKASKQITYFNEGSLFKTTTENTGFSSSIYDFYLETNSSLYSHLISTISIMLAMRHSDKLLPEKFAKAFHSVCETILSLPYSTRECSALLRDARYLELEKSSIDLVITSPPYINVFNYHQNYRKALEFLGWKPLEVAVSEIGANRKHRSNRFLTVIQYCMDMNEVFSEVRRLLHHKGKAVFIVGRVSSVRGITFKNGLLLAMVSIGASGFSIEKWQERVFTNRYGEKIYEDVVTLQATREPDTNNREIAKSVGVWALEGALREAHNNVKDDIRKDIESALMLAINIKVSPKLNVNMPSIHKKLLEEKFDNSLSTLKTQIAIGQ